MIKENKFSKYLIYAIGEIILLVILLGFLTSTRMYLDAKEKNDAYRYELYVNYIE